MGATRAGNAGLGWVGGAAAGALRDDERNPLMGTNGAEGPYAVRHVIEQRVPETDVVGPGIYFPFRAKRRASGCSSTELVEQCNIAWCERANAILLLLEGEKNDEVRRVVKDLIQKTSGRACAHT